jgi:hypothetical protein
MRFRTVGLQTPNQAQEFGPIRAGARGFFPVEAGYVIPLRPGSGHDIELSGKVLFAGADTQLEPGDFHS